MSNHTIPIWVKNMAGALVTVLISSGLPPQQGLEAVRRELAEGDAEAYPYERTRVMRVNEEEKEPLQADEPVYLFLVEPARLESVEIQSQQVPRIVVPVGERTLYLYWITSGTNVRFFVSVDERRDHLIRFYDCHSMLSSALDAVAEMSVEDRSAVYRQAIPLLSHAMDRYDTQLQYTFWADPNERLQCDCGSVIQRKGMENHMRTRKHVSYAQAHPAVNTQRWTSVLL
jgi:hypothetical protein